jgi:lipopolysaccharide transport system ATP-binding protein
MSTTLEGMDNRRGNGKIQFTGIEFLSPEGILQKVIRSGDSVVVRMHYCAHEPIAYPCFGFRMYTELETMVTEVGTSHHGIYISNLEAGEGYVDLEIDSLNLMAAKYKLSLWLTDMPGQLVYDNIEHAVTFQVEAANLFQSGRAMDGRQGIVFFPQKWNLAGLSGQVKHTPSLMDSKESVARD